MYCIKLQKENKYEQMLFTLKIELTFIVNSIFRNLISQKLWFIHKYYLKKVVWITLLLASNSLNLLETIVKLFHQFYGSAETLAQDATFLVITMALLIGERMKKIVISRIILRNNVKI